MDLFCPHCTRRVTVSDDKAGLVVNCPLCTKQFMAPSLAPPPPAPPPPPPPSYDIGPPPVPPPPVPLPTPTPKPRADATPPPPPPPPGDYTGSFTFRLRGILLPYVPAACMLAIFVLSFFGWHHHTTSVSMWGLANTNGWILVYAVLLIPSVVLTLASCLLDRNQLPLPPALAPLVGWKDVIVTALLAVGFLMLAFDYISAHFSTSHNPILLPLKIAIRLHLVATIASLLLFWLHRRKRSNLPPPKLEVRW